MIGVTSPSKSHRGRFCASAVLTAHPVAAVHQNNACPVAMRPGISQSAR
jgi:hypothetical protein